MMREEVGLNPKSINFRAWAPDMAQAVRPGVLGMRPRGAIQKYIQKLIIASQ